MTNHELFIMKFVLLMCMSGLALSQSEFLSKLRVETFEQFWLAVFEAAAKRSQSDKAAYFKTLTAKFQEKVKEVVNSKDGYVEGSADKILSELGTEEAVTQQVLIQAKNRKLRLLNGSTDDTPTPLATDSKTPKAFSFGTLKVDFKKDNIIDDKDNIKTNIGSMVAKLENNDFFIIEVGRNEAGTFVLLNKFEDKVFSEEIIFNLMLDYSFSIPKNIKIDQFSNCETSSSLKGIKSFFKFGIANFASFLTCANNVEPNKADNVFFIKPNGKSNDEFYAFSKGPIWRVGDLSNIKIPQTKLDIANFVIQSDHLRTKSSISSAFCQSNSQDKAFVVRFDSSLSISEVKFSMKKNSHLDRYTQIKNSYQCSFADDWDMNVSIGGSVDSNPLASLLEEPFLRIAYRVLFQQCMKEEITEEYKEPFQFANLSEVAQRIAKSSEKNGVFTIYVNEQRGEMKECYDEDVVFPPLLTEAEKSSKTWDFRNQPLPVEEPKPESKGKFDGIYNGYDLLVKNTDRSVKPASLELIENQQKKSSKGVSLPIGFLDALFGPGKNLNQTLTTDSKANANSNVVEKEKSTDSNKPVVAENQGDKVVSENKLENPLSQELPTIKDTSAVGENDDIAAPEKALIHKNELEKDKLEKEKLEREKLNNLEVKKEKAETTNIQPKATDQEQKIDLTDTKDTVQTIQAVVEPKKEEVVQPKINVEPKKEEVVQPKIVVEPKKEEVVQPKIDVEPKKEEIVQPRIVVQPKIDVEPKKKEVVQPKVNVEPKKEEVVQSKQAVVEPKKEDVVEPKKEEVVQPKIDVEPKKEEVVEPKKEEIPIRQEEVQLKKAVVELMKEVVEPKNEEPPQLNKISEAKQEIVQSTEKEKQEVLINQKSEFPASPKPLKIEQKKIVISKTMTSSEQYTDDDEDDKTSTKAESLEVFLGVDIVKHKTMQDLSLVFIKDFMKRLATKKDSGKTQSNDRNNIL